MTYLIAGNTVNMTPQGKILYHQAKPYLTEEKNAADITIDLNAEKIMKLKDAQGHLSYDEVEYIYGGYVFYNSLIHFGGFFLHASAVAVDGKAYLFSAPSGTGKSTHTGLWVKYLGGRAEIINDDKPAIRRINGEYYVFGTPFSGKTNLNKNICARIGGVCILERAEENSMDRINSSEAIYPILNQTLRPKDEKPMDVLLDLLDGMLKQIPVYRLYCNMCEEAAVLSYRTMSGGIE